MSHQALIKVVSVKHADVVDSRVRQLPAKINFTVYNPARLRKTPLLGSISESTLARIERECQKSQKLIATLQANMVDRAESARQRAEALKAKDGRVARPGRDG